MSFEETFGAITNPINETMRGKSINEGTVDFMGHQMSVEQKEELIDMLKEDILDRYNNPEYWSQDIVDEFAQDNKLESAKKNESVNEKTISIAKAMNILGDAGYGIEIIPKGAKFVGFEGLDPSDLEFHYEDEHVIGMATGLTDQKEKNEEEDK